MAKYEVDPYLIPRAVLQQGWSRGFKGNKENLNAKNQLT